MARLISIVPTNSETVLIKIHHHKYPGDIDAKLNITEYKTTDEKFLFIADLLALDADDYELIDEIEEELWKLI